MKRRKRTGIISMLFLGIALILSGCGGGGGGSTSGDNSTTYTVGGTVSGLSGGTVVLQNNAGDDLAITSDGTFTFLTALADGSGYNVTVKTTPAGQSCTVSNASGTISGADVTDVTVDCAKSGTLDKTFGKNKNGIVTYNSGGSYNYVGNSITTDADGKILVTGYKKDDNGNDKGMTIWRYKTDGTLDKTFNSPNGFVTYNNNGGYGSSITTDADGKILVTGYNDNVITIWRYKTDGSLDATFNTGKGDIVDENYGPSITTDTNKKILVTGSDNVCLTIWKYNTDGSLDKNFDSDGIAIYKPELYSYGYSITTDADGILVTGKILNDNYDMAIWRYKTDGSLDGNFGSDGIATYNNSKSYGSSITTDADGILVTGGRWNGKDYDMAIWRYTDGTPDENFGTNKNGIAISNRGHTESGNSITTDADANILVTGFSNPGSASSMVIWRYKKDGTLDTAFGTGGIVTYNIESYNSGRSITTDADGKILVTGFSGKGMAIWRYIP